MPGSLSSGVIKRTFEHRSILPHDVRTAFAWHEREGAITRLTPPWEPVRLIHADPGIATGVRVVMRLSLAGPITKDWVAEHTDYDPPHLFRDRQASGPFAHWDHQHRFSPTELPDGTTGTLMHDHVEYAAPLGPLGALGDPIIRNKLTRMFAYRHATLAGDLAAHARFADRPRQTVLITGATGLIGSSLDALLSTGGHTVRRLTRTLPAKFATSPKPGGPNAAPDSAAAEHGWFAWNPDEGWLDERALDGVDAVVHLAGENLAAKRWTPKFKQSLVESRLLSTALLAERMATRPSRDRPRTLIVASGINAYPQPEELGGEPATEATPLRAPRTSFLADLVRGWEAAAEPAREVGIRTAHLRIGAVLTPAGGALKQMLTPFMLGLGGPIGSGRQYLPWISLDDVLDATLRILMDEALEGPINLIAPEPIRQRDFARTLAKVLKRPAFLPTPGVALRAVFGQLADEALLASRCAIPAKLNEAGHQFRHPELEPALRHLLGKPA